MKKSKTIQWLKLDKALLQIKGLRTVGTVEFVQPIFTVHHAVTQPLLREAEGAIVAEKRRCYARGAWWKRGGGGGGGAGGGGGGGGGNDDDGCGCDDSDDDDGCGCDDSDDGGSSDGGDDVGNGC